jgi:5,10-methylenetetrahydromethanopterin reductase
MRVSLFGLVGGTAGRCAVDETVAYLTMVRDAGFGRVWMGQWPMHRDLLTVLAAAMREVDTVEVASGVLPIQNQHPMLMAQRALTLNELSGGRFILGVGVTHRVISEEWWGIPWTGLVGRLDEYLDGLQPLLAGQPADVAGATVTTRGALEIPVSTPPPVYVAALGPRMLELAGRRTRGTFTWMTGPVTLSSHVLPGLRRAAADAGRADSDVEVVAGLPVCVTDDVDGARRLAAEQLAFYGTLPSYRAMLEREGLTAPEDVAIIGDEAAVRDMLHRVRDIGVDELVAVTVDDSPESSARTRALLRSIS